MIFRVFIHNEADERHLAHLFDNTGNAAWTITRPRGEVEVIYPTNSTLWGAVSIYLDYKYGFESVDWCLTKLCGPDGQLLASNDYDCVVQGGRLPPLTPECTINRDPIPGIALTNFSNACGEAAERLEEFCDSLPSQPKFPRRRYLTMMPYSSYEKTAQCLTTKDLKRMRVVALRVFYAIKNNTILIKTSYERSVGLWREHFQSLIRYGIMIGKEIKLRGEKDSSIEVFRSEYAHVLHVKPPWVYWPKLQRSHQSYLKLRELRDQTVKYINDQHPEGARQYLRDNCLPHVHNLAWLDIVSILPQPNMHSHYYILFGGGVIKEQFVFPRRNNERDGSEENLARPDSG